MTHHNKILENSSQKAYKKSHVTIETLLDLLIEDRDIDIMDKNKIVKLPTIRRLPLYLYLLEKHFDQGRTTISSNHLAKEMNVEPIVVRKDLTITDIVGKPRIGYDIEALIKAIRSFIYWDSSQEGILIGSGNLGSAILQYSGFEQMGFSIPVAFDMNDELAGKQIGQTTVYSMEEMPHLIERMGWKLAVLCVPAPAAQSLANQLIELGINAIWNFAPVRLQVPEHVVVQQENLIAGLTVLRVKQQKMESSPLEDQ